MELFAARGYFFCRYCGSFHFPDTKADDGVRIIGEAPSRVVVSASSSAESEIVRRATEAGVPALRLGRTTTDGRLQIRAGDKVVDVGGTELRGARESCLAAIVGI